MKKRRTSASFSIRGVSDFLREQSLEGIVAGPCLGLTQYNQGFLLLILATTLKGEKLSKTDLIETFIHELVPVRLFAEGQAET
jgi:hypothetical protein